MANRRYTEKLKVSIECKDEQLPSAILQAGQVANITLGGSDVQLGNTQAQQLLPMKGADALPLIPSKSAEVPLLPAGRRVGRG